MNNFLSKRLIQTEQSLIRKIFENAPEDSINLGLGEIQFKIPDVLKIKGKKILDQGYIRYTPNAGIFELRQVVAGYYQNKISAGNVCITCGAEAGIFISLFSYLDAGDEVMIADPTFVAYKSILNMLQAKVLYFDLDPDNNFRLDRVSFQKNISSRTKILLLNNPSNPLSTTFTNDEMDLIITKCRENNILLIVDEIYRELFLEKRPHSVLEQYENSIIISGISKSHSFTGGRLGWVVSQNESLIQPLIPVHQYVCTCAPYISQQIGISALSGKGMRTVAETRGKLKKNHDILESFLENNSKCRIVQSTAAPYLFINLGIDDKQLADDLLKYRIIVIPGSAFGINGKNWIRINYAIEEDRLEETIIRIKKYLLKKGIK